MATFKYLFVTAIQQQPTPQQKIWLVADVSDKQHIGTGQELSAYANILGQEAWELVSDTIGGASRELVFKQETK